MLPLTFFLGNRVHSLYYQVIFANNWKSKLNEVQKQVRSVMSRKNQDYTYVSFTNDILMGFMLCGSVADLQISVFVYSKQKFKWIASSSLYEHILDLSGPNLLPDIGPEKEV